MKIELDYNTNGATHYPPINSDVVPDIGDIVRISDVRHRVAQREFFVEKGELIAYLTFEDLGTD